MILWGREQSAGTMNLVSWFLNMISKWCCVQQKCCGLFSLISKHFTFFVAVCVKIQKIREDVEFYIDTYQEDNFVENDFLYDELDLEDLGVAMRPDPVASSPTDSNEVESLAGSSSPPMITPPSSHSKVRWDWNFRRPLPVLSPDWLFVLRCLWSLEHLCFAVKYFVTRTLLVIMTRNKKQCRLWGNAITAGPILPITSRQHLPYLYTLFRKSQ